MSGQSHGGDRAAVYAETAWTTCVLFPSRYAIIWEKGYQETDVVTSAALTKLKGVQYVANISGRHFPGITDRIWDVADYVVPPQVTSQKTRARISVEAARPSMLE